MSDPTIHQNVRFTGPGIGQNSQSWIEMDLVS
jgi:hypothetical protein